MLNKWSFTRFLNYIINRQYISIRNSNNLNKEKNKKNSNNMERVESLPLQVDGPVTGKTYPGRWGYNRDFSVYRLLGVKPWEALVSG